MVSDVPPGQPAPCEGLGLAAGSSGLSRISIEGAEILRDFGHPRLPVQSLQLSLPVDRRIASVRIVGGGDHSCRVVEQVVHQIGFDSHGRAVDGNGVGVDIDPPTQIGDRSVDGDPTVGDQFLTCPATAEPQPGEHLLPALAGGVPG